MNTILVAGIGNAFAGDDGFGVEVVRHLQTQLIPVIDTPLVDGRDETADQSRSGHRHRHARRSERS